MQNSVLQRIRAIIDFYSVSDRRFAEAINLPQTTISSLFSRGNEPNVSIVQSVLNVYTRISPEWLITGEGSMLKSKGSTNDDQQELIAELKEEIIALNAENKVLREIAGLAERKESKSKSA